MSRIESGFRPTSDSRLGGYTLLLCAMLGFLVARPFFSGIAFRELFQVALMVGLFVLARPGRLWVPPALALVPSLAAALVLQFGSSPAALAVGLGAGAVFLATAAGTLLLMLLEQDHVTGDTILGGICVYLLVGLTFLMAFSVLEWLVPGSFLADGKAIVSPSLGHYPQLIYFSFVTLTTLGFGDVLPVTASAQMLSAAEAVLGQVYLVVFVARLVGLHITQTR